MKKIVLLLLCLAIFFLFTACADKTTDDQGANDEINDTDESNDTEGSKDEDSESGNNSDETTHELEYTLSEDRSYYVVSGIGSYDDSSLIIPERYNDLPVSKIGDYAFTNNQSIKTVNIPQSVTNIGRYAFAFCNNISEINVSDVNKNYKSIDGNLYTKDGTRLIQYALDKHDTVFTVPNGVERIEGYAFNGAHGIVSLIIADSVTYISTDAFGHDHNLERVFYKGSGMDWAKGSFNLSFNYLDDADVCFYSESEPELIGNFWHYSDDIAVMWEQVSDCVFSENLSFSLNPDGESYALHGIGECVDTEIIIPQTYLGLPVTEIAHMAFYPNEELIGITIPKTVTSVSPLSLTYCYNLKNISVDEESEHLKASNGALYTKDGKTLILYAIGRDAGEFIVPDGVINIGERAFAFSDSLSKIELPESLVTIGLQAFMGCQKLTEIVIPDNLTTIDNYAFSCCYNLASAVIGEKSKLEIIGCEAFNECYKLTNIKIPVGVHSIGKGAFKFCHSLSSITVDDENSSYTSINGHLYSADGKILINYAIGNTDTVFTIPDGVTHIGEFAFYYSGYLTRVNMPEGLISIGDSAFEKCEILISMTFPDSVTDIGRYAFCECQSLTSVTLGSGITNITVDAFRSCTALYVVYNNSNLSLTAGRTSHGAVAGYAKAIVDDGTITYSDSGTYILTDDKFLFTRIGDTYKLIAYVGNDDIVTFPRNIDGNGYEIYHMRGVINAIIPDEIQNVGDMAFYHCTSLKSLKIGNGAKSIGDMAFINCSRLEDITIGDSVASIGRSAFHYCYNLSSITLGNGLNTVSEYAFSYCNGISNVYYKGTPQEWSEIAVDPDMDNHNLTDAPRYYYSETEPDVPGSFWYYDENGEITVW